jgi:23S rRNA (guanosine2251-2'-O)-methyltransferase
MGRKIRPGEARNNRHANLAGDSPSMDENQFLDALPHFDGEPFLLILDGVTDPHNLGACLRSANAAGVHAVIVPKDRSAHVTDTVRRIACGGAEAVPIVYVTNLARFMRQLKDQQVWLVGASADAREIIYNRDLTGPIALVMGAEGSGLRRLSEESCDFLVKLPMAGTVESLNVSVAAGICLFEVVRQRGSKTGN